MNLENNMSEYEFTAEQNASIDAFRKKLTHIAWLMFGIGVSMMVVAHREVSGVGLWHMTFGAMMFVFMGFVYYRPVDNFKRITSTEGHDVHELMIAMDDLRIAFTAGQVLFVILTALVLAEIIWR
jgi:hypothetical protein